MDDLKEEIFSDAMASATGYKPTTPQPTKELALRSLKSDNPLVRELAAGLLVALDQRNFSMQGMFAIPMAMGQMKDGEWQEHIEQAIHSGEKDFAVRIPKIVSGEEVAE